MNLQAETFQFKFLTPCFSGTAEGKDGRVSELRIPAIRGHIRFWHRAAYGVASANQLWGNTDGTEGGSSRVALKLTAGPAPSERTAMLLPHKSHGQGSRPALPVESAASIKLQRLPGCAKDDWDMALTTTRLWLVAGTLGYRSSRAAGSVWPREQWAPSSSADLSLLLRPLIGKPIEPWGAALVGEAAGQS